MSEAGLVGELRGNFRGGLIAPEDSGYDEARKVWNGMIDKRPALIAQRSTSPARRDSPSRFAEAVTTSPETRRATAVSSST